MSSNNSNTLDMTKGNHIKIILTFAFPIFLSQLFQQLYNTADSLIVGNFLDTNSLAAVASSGNLIFLFNSFFMGTAIGAGIVISKYFGAKDYDKMKDAIHTDIAFGLTGGLILTLLGFFTIPYILRLMGTDPDVLPYSISYFRTYFLGSVAVVSYNIFNGICNAVGNSKRPLYYLITSSCLNIVLDLIFVGGFRWGVWSAALATVISQVTSAILCFTFLIRKGTVYQVTPSKIRFHKDLLKEIFVLGVPTGIQNSVIALANVVVQSHINAFGSVAMAACGTYFKIEGFAFLPIGSFTMAITTFISQNFGAGQNARAKQGARFGILSSVLLAESIGVAIYFLAPHLIHFFDDNPEVIAIGTKQAHVESLFFFLLAYSHCIAAVCRGSGRSIIPMFVMLSIWCFGRVGYLTIMSHYSNDISYIFWAYPLTWCLSSIVYFFYYKFSGWEKGFKIKHAKN